MMNNTQHAKNFLRKTYKTGLDFEKVESRPGNVRWEKNTRHFKCKITTGKSNRRQYTFYYSMGPDLKGAPHLYDVLVSLRDSAIMADSSFEEIRKLCETDAEAQEVLKGCQGVKKGLERLFGALLPHLLEEPK